jgi:hypothetical protein
MKVVNLVDKFMDMLFNKYPDILNIEVEGKPVIGYNYTVYFPKNSKNAKELINDSNTLYGNCPVFEKDDMTIVMVTRYRNDAFIRLWEGESKARTKLNLTSLSCPKTK